jgi:flagellar hook assembly protein FlgD
MEGRDAASFNDWLSVVGAMFGAVGIVGINEVTTDQTVRALELSVVPDVVVETAMISYSVPATGEVSLQIFDEVGREVCSIMDGYRKVGTYRITWNGKDNQGVQVSNGVYFARLMSDNTFVTRKFVLVR